MLRYRYRGVDPDHHDNRGLREAMRQRFPLIYFHGIVEGKYEADYPVFVVGDSPESLTFTVSVDERRFCELGTDCTSKSSANGSLRLTGDTVRRVDSNAISYSRLPTSWLSIVRAGQGEYCATA